MDQYVRRPGSKVQQYAVASNNRGKLQSIRRQTMRKEPKWLKCAIIQMMAIVVGSTFVALLVHGIAIDAKRRTAHKIEKEIAKSLKVANITPANISYIDEPTLGTNYDNKACQNLETSWSMVFFVKSQASNFQRRELIRRTWASLSNVDGANFTTVFVIGEAKFAVSQKRFKYHNNLLEEEKYRYRDILHYDGPDDYKNIGFKTLIGMRWASENLPDDFFYASVDDDFMLNIGELEDLIDGYVTNGTDPFPIICGFGMYENAAPFRDPSSKWYISKQEFSKSAYPKFCLGGMYAMRVRLVQTLWEIAQFRSPMRVDDVWITGILREEIGLSPSMLVKPSNTIAKHLDNYKNTRFYGQRMYMRSQWIEMYKLFRHKSMCVRPFVYLSEIQARRTRTKKKQKTKRESATLRRGWP